MGRQKTKSDTDRHQNDGQSEPSVVFAGGRLHLVPFLAPSFIAVTADSGSRLGISFQPQAEKRTQATAREEYKYKQKQRAEHDLTRPLASGSGGMDPNVKMRNKTQRHENQSEFLISLQSSEQRANKAT